MIESILRVVQTWSSAFVDDLPPSQLLLDLVQEMILFLFYIAKTHGSSHWFLVIARPWDFLLLGVAEEIPTCELDRVPRCQRIGGSFDGKLEVGFEVAGFHFSLAGFEVGPEWKIVVLVEMLGFVEGLLFFCVLLQQLTLETRQIVHQYIYYNPRPSTNIYTALHPMTHPQPNIPFLSLLPPSFFLLSQQILINQITNCNR